jgi:hypothetical protein
VLFSQPALAEFIGAHFEPVWQKVREAPQVRVDFGGGNVVRRTLHGNIATWILDGDGYVMDVIGGVYTPAAYRARLDEALRLVRHVRPRHPRWDKYAPQVFATYHGRQANALAQHGLPLHLRSQGVNKAGVERWALVAMGNGVDAEEAASSGDARTTALHRLIAPAAPAPVALADITKRVVERAPRAAAALDTLPLDADVKLNETVRREAIHRILAEVGLVQLDAALTARVYRDALHCDIDDPYLGLADLLFRQYPFAQ